MTTVSSGPARSSEPAGPFVFPPFYVLAGGKSRRMGRDKRAIDVGGRRLLDHAIALGEGFESVAVVAKERPEALPEGIRFLADRSDEVMPIHGVEVALGDAAARGAEWAILLAVDLPLLRRPTLAALARLAADEPAECRAVVPVVDGRLQVLAAAWRPRVADEIAARLAARDPSLFRLVESGPWRRIEPEDLGASVDEFLNVNRPEDLARAEEILAGQGGRGGRTR